MPGTDGLGYSGWVAAIDSCLEVLDHIVEVA